MIAEKISLIPVLSEKAMLNADSKNVYVFKVPVAANKLQVAAAVESQYDVRVSKVNLLKQKGKTVSSYKKRSRPITAYRKDFKKAYVTLATGDIIQILPKEDKSSKSPKPVKEGKK
jgi:large subunit ribosomal protein L23